LAEEMNAAAFPARQVKQWAGERGRYGENRKSVSAGERAHASAPFFDRSARLVGPMRRGIENHALAAARPDRLARQDKDRSSGDVMPASPQDDGYAPFQPHR
jgi:hypothetical protein